MKKRKFREVCFLRVLLTITPMNNTVNHVLLSTSSTWAGQQQSRSSSPSQVGLLMSNAVYLLLCVAYCVVTLNWLIIYARAIHEPPFEHRNPKAGVFFGVLAVLHFGIERIVIVVFSNYPQRSGTEWPLVAHVLCVVCVVCILSVVQYIYVYSIRIRDWIYVRVCVCV